jgi:antitoxin CptB
MSEPRETKIKRLKLRSMRRGIKEMDLILGGFGDAGLSDLSDDRLDLYDRMLSENDHDLYAWANGQEAAPDEYAALMSHIMDLRKP